MTIKTELEKEFQSCNIDKIKILLNQYLAEYSNDYDRFSYLCNYNILIGNYNDALMYAKTAIKLNPHCVESNFNLAYVYDLMEDYPNAYLYYLILKTLQDKRNIICIPDNTIVERLNYIRQIAEENDFLRNYILYAENYIQYSSNDPFHIITELIGFPIMPDNNLYICGRYNDLMNQFFIDLPPKDSYRCKVELLETTGIQANKLIIDENTPCILPVFSSDDNKQELTFTQNDTSSFSYILGAKNTWYYFRINQKTEITSKSSFINGAPILCKHKPGNKKLVLNIFIDSFSFRVFQLFPGNSDSIESFKKLMPNSYNFFSKGIICTNAYADSEWTTPSLSSYCTGKYSDKTMNLNTDVWFPFDSDTKLLSEYFDENDYFTAIINSNDSCTPSKGYMRGVKRELYKARGYNKEELIADTLEQLRAFRECDQFVTLEIEDLHDIAGSFPRSISIQTTTDIKHLETDNYMLSTVKQTRSLNKQKIYMNELSQLDYYLGFIFDYIESNYNPDDYVVSLFSDHGTAFMVDDSELTICKQRTNVPFMFRDNIHQGITSEFIQNVDFPAILCNMCGIDYNFNHTDSNLPEFLGGDKREFAFAQTIFPGDCYQAAIMTHQYTYYFLSKAKVNSEFRIDISDSSYDVIYDNESNSLCTKSEPDMNHLTNIVLKHIQHLIIQ